MFLHKTSFTLETVLGVLVFPSGVGRRPGILSDPQQVGTSLGLVPLAFVGSLVPVLPPAWFIAETDRSVAADEGRGLCLTSFRGRTVQPLFFR